MKPVPAKKPAIRVAVVESDPLRFVGFRTLFDSEPDLELHAVTATELATRSNIDPAWRPWLAEPVRFDGRIEGFAARSANHRHGDERRRRDHPENHRGRRQGLHRRGLHRRRVRPSDPYRASGLSMGAAACTFDVHRACQLRSRKNLSGRAESCSPSEKRKYWNCWLPGARTKKSEPLLEWRNER